MTLANHTILISHKRWKNFDQTTFATSGANFCTASSPVELHHERQIRTPRALAGAAAAIEVHRGTFTNAWCWTIGHPDHLEEKRLRDIIEEIN